jgi:predicted HTH domain antitoxin
VTVEIQDDVLKAAGISPEELKLEVAVLLFQRGLTAGQASHVAGLALYDFLQELARRGIGPHYGVADFEQDLETLDRERRS